MKVCSKCKKSLPDDAFASNRARKDGKTHSCRACHAEYTRAHYAANKQAYIERRKARSVAIQSRITEMKRAPCTDCGESFPPIAMDFDHVRGKKAFNLSVAGVRGVSEARLQRELEKCDLVCSNCHRIRTHNRRKKLT